MSWVGKQKRWMKMYRGKRYAVSCRQLGVPATKDDSWHAANTWWESKQVELDLAARLPVDSTTANVVQVLERGRLMVKVNETQEVFGDIICLLEAFRGERLSTMHDIQAAADALIEAQNTKPLMPGFAAQVLGEDREGALCQRLPLILSEPMAPPDRTVGGQIIRWITMQQALAGAGKITADRADNNRICLNHFKNFIGAATPLESINEQKLHDFFVFCLGKVEAGRQFRRNGDAAQGSTFGPDRHAAPSDQQRIRTLVEAKTRWSVDYAKKVFGVAKTFIRFLWESRLVELPRNIDSKVFRFGSSTRAIRTWTVDEFKTAIDAATGQLKLHLLLMANCGMLQTDISELLDEEVDWTEGRIKRKRSKTRDSQYVPTVDYKLWPITFELLKKHRSGSKVVLLTESGNRWVDKRLIDGRLVKADNIASCYTWLKKRTGFTKPLKQIRKTSASFIEGHPHYGRYKDQFLGHSPRSIADRHYAAPSSELFDEIVLWLGHQYGIAMAK